MFDQPRAFRFSALAALAWASAARAACATTVTLVAPTDGAVVSQGTVDFQCSAASEAGLGVASLYLGTLGDPQKLVFSGPGQTEDTQISADSPTTNYGAAVSINVDGATPHAHGLFKVPDLIGPEPTQVPTGAAILSATLEVHCTNLGNVMSFYRLTEDWAESLATWEQREAGVPWSVAGTDGAGSRDSVGYSADCTATGWRTIDLTDIVQAWADGADNYGIVLTDGGTDGVDFDTSESANPPRLTVTFEVLTSWYVAGTQELPSATHADITFEDVPVADGNRYIWNCEVTDTSEQEPGWAPADWRFTVDLHYPAAPVLIAPADGALHVSTSPELQVSVSDPDPGQTLDVTFLGSDGQPGNPFTIAVLPDTQKYVLNDGLETRFYAQTQWIKDHRASDDIVFVTHEGDIVDTYYERSQWLEAQTCMKVLDGVVPYGVLPGNHDQPTTLYNEYFPYSTYAGYAWYGGHYPAYTNDNNYQLFSAGGLDFLIVHLQYWPTNYVIAWADSVLKAYPQRRAIITTHGYLDVTGARNVYGMGSTQYIWDNLVVPNDNVFFVLCGHMHGEYTRTDEVNGRLVHQLLADYQSLSDGGQGYLRLMRFVPAEDTVYVQTYSPYLDAYQTDADSQFALAFPMNGFRELGAQTGVASGQPAALIWPARPTGTRHEWFVRVTDSSDRTTTGPVWSFYTTSTDTEPPVIAEVAAGEVAENSARITWTTDELADSRVAYRRSSDAADFTWTPLDASLVTAHAVLLTGLQPSTGYEFRVASVDGSGNAATSGTYGFTTAAANRPPVGSDASLVTDEDVPAPITLEASDPDGDPLGYAIVDPPGHGTLTGAPPELTYTPDADYHGLDGFTFQASDGQLASNVATVSIIVLPQVDAYVESEPLVLYGSVVGSYQGTQTLGDGQVQSLAEVPNGQAGMASLDAQYSLHTSAAPSTITALTFYLAAEWTGSEPLIVSIWNGAGWDEIAIPSLGNASWAPSGDLGGYVDSGGDILVRFADSGAVRKEAKDTLTIDLLYADVAVSGETPPANRAPVAQDDSAATSSGTPVRIEVLANDSDPDGDTLTIAEISPKPSNGEAAITEDGAAIVYTPSPGFLGTDSFSYRVTDPVGLTATATVTVDVAEAPALEAMGVTSITMELTQAGKNWKASALVSVNRVTDPAFPVSGAIVTGDWSLEGALLESGVTAVTDATGVAVVTSAPVRAKSGEQFKFVITDIAAQGYWWVADSGPSSCSVTVP